MDLVIEQLWFTGECLANHLQEIHATKYLSREQVLDALIAYGWIDGIRRKLDYQRTMQLISQRKTQSWSATYKQRAERLVAADRMQPAGRDAITQSKRLGLWDVMQDVDALVVPTICKFC